MNDLLHQIFTADRTLRNAEAKLLAGDASSVRTILEAAVREAQTLDDQDEANLRLERLADLCAQLTGDEMADSLIAILNWDHPPVRGAAAEALLDFAYDYYSVVAKAVERALDQGLRGPAMSEIPFMLAEIGEPSAAKLLKRFLQHDDAEVVAAAIEAAVELGDDGLVGAIEALQQDHRDVTLDDFEEETQATIAELATEALAALKS